MSMGTIPSRLVATNGCFIVFEMHFVDANTPMLLGLDTFDLHKLVVDNANNVLLALYQ